MSTQNKTRLTQTAQPEHSGTGEQGRAAVMNADEEGGAGGAVGGVGGQTLRALTCPTFSDADQLMYSTVTLATWKDNAVSMSHAVMEGTRDKTETAWKHIQICRDI